MMTDFQRAAANRPDYSTREGAEALKAKIKAHWRAQGFSEPEIEAVKVVGDWQSRSGDQMRHRYELRSDMVGAMPKRSAQP